MSRILLTSLFIYGKIKNKERAVTLMEKQTKNIITRKQIEKDLLFSNTASIKHTAVCLAAVVLVLGVISAIFLFNVL